MRMAEALLKDRLTRLRACCEWTADGGDTYAFAIPFYANISLLAWQRDKLGHLPASWSDMADAALRNSDGLYFACHAVPANYFESYNCLFLEILHSTQRPVNSADCSFAQWLTRDRKKTEEALRCFHALLQPFHKRVSEAMTSSRSDEEWQKLQSAWTSEALISRHWYNTLNQMMATLLLSRRAQYQVDWLPSQDPDRRYMTTAGEWYLAVPQYSAAPEIALDVIEFLTNPDKEMQRVHIGVGLPTRRDYYQPQGPGVPSDISPYFLLDMTALEEAIRSAFRRSQFSCYQAFAETMSSHLQRMLETDRPLFSKVLDGILGSLDFFRRREMCNTCKLVRPSVTLPR
jgi:hypothetical protein